MASIALQSLLPLWYYELPDKASRDRMQDALDDMEDQFEQAYNDRAAGKSTDWPAVQLDCAMGAWSVIDAELCALGDPRHERPAPADEIRAVSLRALVSLLRWLEEESRRRHIHIFTTALELGGDLTPAAWAEVKRHSVWDARKKARRAGAPPPPPRARSRDLLRDPHTGQYLKDVSVKVAADYAGIEVSSIYRAMRTDRLGFNTVKGTRRPRVDALLQEYPPGD